MENMRGSANAVTDWPFGSSRILEGLSARGLDQHRLKGKLAYGKHHHNLINILL